MYIHIFFLNHVRKKRKRVGKFFCMEMIFMKIDFPDLPSASKLFFTV